MEKHRLFLAINLPSKIKEKLLDYQDYYSDLPVKWTPKANLHITLVFLDDTGSEKISQITKISKEVSGELSEFSCKLQKVVLAPPGSPPRMFWVRVEKNDRLIKLQNKLEQNLVQAHGTGYKEKSDRDYLPHITLGRINQDKWKQLQERPRITESLDLTFRVDSFELMESELKHSGAEYHLRDSYSIT